MIITKAPLRMSFVGGGTDLPSFYQTTKGSVISTSINKYVYITVHHRFEENIRVAYSEIEISKSFKDVKHPLIRNVAKILGIERNLEISSVADIPSGGTGLGSSSAFTVALIEALSNLNGTRLSKHEIAELACKVEIEMCNEPIGKQDQYAAAFGGMRRYDFHPDGKVSCKSLDVNQEFLEYFEKNVLLLYTGKTRAAKKILATQSQIQSHDKKFQSLKDLAALVDPFEDALNAQDIYRVGELLNEGWMIKRGLVNGITDNDIDAAYDAAVTAGAIGGKLLGAGAGGFLMLVAPLTHHKKIIENLHSMKPVSIRFDRLGVNKIFGESA